MGPIYDTAVIHHFDRAMEIARERDHAKIHLQPGQAKSWRLSIPLALVALACLLPVLGS
ncbi:MAG: hypothetical protein AAGH74_17780 [Pseudomonadota bacterium]